MNTHEPVHMFDSLFTTARMRKIFSDRERLQNMLDFEGALARAESRAGIVPSGAAEAICAKCHADLVDLPALAHATPASGNLAIPLITQLTSLVAKDNAGAAHYVHWGATSQDVIDTALVLQLRSAFHVISEDLERLLDLLGSLTETHLRSLIPARTWLQQALPTTFGFITAGWLDALLRHRGRLHGLREKNLVLQFGGAAGSLAALGDRGPVVARNLADELKLSLPEIPWHSHRDRVAEVATTLGVLAGTLGKIARDLSLHMQTEVQEVSEPFGQDRGGSSTMPHKQNPVSCAAILASTIRVPGLVATALAAMDQDHQRGFGGWHAEWEILPEIVKLTAGALHHLVVLVPDLVIDTVRMRANLEITRGLIFAEATSMALSEKIGRSAAHQQVEAACRRAQFEQRHLRDVLASDKSVSAVLNASDLDRLFDPANYLGSADTFIERVLASNRARQSQKHIAQGQT